MNLELIKAEIKKRGIKQNWLAGQIDVHPNTLSNFLTGKSMLGTEALVRLLKILNMKFETLMKKAS